MESPLSSRPHSLSLILQASPQLVDLKLFNDNTPALGHDNEQAEVTVKFELIQEGCSQYVVIAKSEGSVPLACNIVGYVFERYQLCTCACARARVTWLKLTRPWC